MPRFAANIDWLFTEMPFLLRFHAAAAAGFRGVEFMFPHGYAARDITEAARQHGLEIVLFNAPAGNWAAGERGIASLPDRTQEFEAGIHLAVESALLWHCKRVHVLGGIRNPSVSQADQRQRYVDSLRYAATLAKPHDIVILVESINPFDVPGYLVHTQAESSALCRDTGMPNVKMQLDLYHAQRSEGDLAGKLRRYHGQYAHVQIAGVPGRNEPVPSEINYVYLFRLLDDLSYDGWIGCEYTPISTTAAGLGWLQF